MKPVSVALLLLLLSARGVAVAGEPGPTRRGFLAFLQTWGQAQDRFINGDPTAWLRSVSHSGDATIYGAFGGYERGADVDRRYEWAASQYEHSGAAKKIEYLSLMVSGDLAVTVSIERDRARVKGRKKPIDQTLRVTQVFRWEARSWKLLHRHADPMLEKKAPSQEGPQ